MEPNLLQILFLGLIQGAAELLPVSSSAHVIVAEKLMGLDPSSPSMTFLLVMLHTGTMFAVIAYFWKAWKRSFFSDAAGLRSMVVNVGSATLVTMTVGLALKIAVERVFLRGTPKAEMEHLFGNLPLVGAALFAAGVLILVTGILRQRDGQKDLALSSSLWIGASQGLCLPFRGLSRSGTTISAGMLLGVARRRTEEFSFALAVVLTPPAVAKELLRLLKSRGEAAFSQSLIHLTGPGLIGMVGAFLAGLLALRLLSSWLEKGHWSWFGYYCLAFSGLVFLLSARGL